MLLAPLPTDGRCDLLPLLPCLGLLPTSPILWLLFFSQTSHATVVFDQRAAASTSIVLDGVTCVNKVRF
jgi:hypothetical protein